MNISFYNSDKVKSKITTNEMREACKFFINLLMDKNDYNSLQIDVGFVNHMLKERNHEGESYPEDFESFNWFTINIDPSISRKNILLTLAHEMVHIKQYVMGELHETGNSDISKWKGKKVDDTVINYWDLPWEIEAHGREKGLYHRYVENQKTKGKAKSNRKILKQSSLQAAGC
jgi:hypothetical protein